MSKRNKKLHISFRRQYLDQQQKNISFAGKVLDIGGKKSSKRGDFRPPIHRVESWEYANIDESTEPDYLCYADKINVPENSFDWILMCETLEHLPEPELALDECKRILKPGGKLVLITPFMYAIHADPHDYQRWTPEKYRRELETKRNFTIEELEPMGGVWAVIWDHFNVISSPGGPEQWKKRTRKWLHRLLWIFRKLEKNQFGREKVTTGFSVIARNEK